MKITKEQLEAVFLSENQSKLKDAVLYSLLADSKQLRAQLMFALLKDYGKDAQIVTDAAIAIELIQTYSLIHDDLPLMDDDDFRRNQPSNHKVFGEALALLAGDALLTKAFHHLAISSYTSNQKVLLIETLANAAGISGMIYGQHIDMLAKGYVDSYDGVSAMYSYKTGKLFSAALMMAAVVAEADQDLNRWQNIGEALGIAFQIQDDILEAISTATILGKSKSDQKNQKATMVEIVGLKKAENAVEAIYQDVFEALAACKLEHSNVATLIESVKNRQF